MPPMRLRPSGWARHSSGWGDVPLTLATTSPGEPEIFASIQGEGPSAGRATAFVRLSRCNLACVWCDTAYTWRFSDRFSGGDGFDRAANQISLPEDDVAARIAALGRSRLVITGGEPLLQAPALARMLALLDVLPRAGGGLRQDSTEGDARDPRLRGDALFVEIETNGTVIPPPALAELVHQFNVSPKLAHSGNPAELALRPDALGWFAADPRAWFKFVIAGPGDLAEVLALAQAYAIPAARIFLMPEGRDSATLRTRGKWLAELCAENGLNFSDRLHIHLFGDTRAT